MDDIEPISKADAALEPEALEALNAQREARQEELARLRDEVAAREAAALEAATQGEAE